MNKIKEWFVNTGGPALKSAVQGILDGLVELVTNLGTKMFNAGKQIIGKLKDGLEAKLGEVKAWFQSKLQEIRDSLPFSEPKDPNSPLRGLDKAGEAFGQNLLMGLQRSMPKVAAEVALGLSGGAAVGNSYTFNLSASYAHQERESLAADVRLLQMLYG